MTNIKGSIVGITCLFIITIIGIQHNSQEVKEVAANAISPPTLDIHPQIITKRGGRLRRLFSSYFNQKNDPTKHMLKNSDPRRKLFLRRDLNNNNNYYYYNNDDYNDDDADDDGNKNKYYDDTNDDNANDNYQGNASKGNTCKQYFKAFLEGTTDAKDSCTGYQNAYVAAGCQNYNSNKNNNNNNNNEQDNKDDKDDNEKDDNKRKLNNNGDDDNDDYFSNYNNQSCCQFLKKHYDNYCEETEIITNLHLLLIATILLTCEIARSFINTHKLYWIPEAGGCIIVGTVFGFITSLSPFWSVDNLSFDEDLFLCILLPPIIFEAALSVNKYEFKRRRLAIFMFAAIGTILSTFMTGYIVHYGSKYLSSTTIPLLDSFIFGALISSIDPVSILSVLMRLNLTEKDTIFILVFGESLLNDGVAITLFKTLLTHYNSVSTSVSIDEVFGTIADFFIVGVGSIIIGVICGFAALIYFWFLRKKLNSSMEVASFFLWAGIPYYICDECNLSGIVAIVTIGFFMDIYIAKPKNGDQYYQASTLNGTARRSFLSTNLSASYSGEGDFPDPNLNLITEESNGHYIDLGNNNPCVSGSEDAIVRPSSPSGAKSVYTIKSFRTLNIKELIMREERFRLTVEADKHVRFVARLLASLSENCIFVYLGVFLFSKQYSWNLVLISVSIFSCVLSRAAMVSIVSKLVWYINIFRQKFGWYKPNPLLIDDLEDTEPMVSRTAKALQDRKIQLVLILAGLRGAVSLALVESVPIYNAVSNTGSNYKPEMKAMTSASILFTIFVIGGSSHYILQRLNIMSDHIDTEPSVQLARFPSTGPHKPEEPLKKTTAFARPISNEIPDIS